MYQQKHALTVPNYLQTSLRTLDPVFQGSITDFFYFLQFITEYKVNAGHLTRS